MKFRTEIEIEEPAVKISYKDKILSVGSCFAENIADGLSSHFLNVLGNPFGVLYNPAAILNMFLLAKEKKELKRNDLIFHGGQWHSFYHNSEFSDDDVNVCLQNVNNSIFELNKFLRNVDSVILTLGTSFVYEHIESKLIVSNCHKIPQKFFSRRMLQIEESYSFIKQIIEIIRIFNKNAKIILTVSPVRHIKDGLHGNQLSKAYLLIAVDNLVQENERVLYFPSYEIVNDDLRDYRFYAEDLVHPNEAAVKYIREIFSEYFFDEETKEFYRDTNTLAKALQHRAVNPRSVKYKEFLNFSLKLVEQMKTKYPQTNFNKAEEYFRARLNEFKKGKTFKLRND